VGSRAGLDAKARGKLLCLCRGSNPGIILIQIDIIYAALAVLLGIREMRVSKHCRKSTVS
jgi:hypothetical protein